MARRSEQRRAAVFALYQHDLTGRPLDEVFEPGVRGDTASGGGNKPATLETGATIQVPLFVNIGDRVKVDTRSGSYMSRA